MNKIVAIYIYLLFSQSFFFKAIAVNVESECNDHGRLEVKLTTGRLVAKSVKDSDLEDLVELYGDSKVMAKFGNGLPRSRERTEQTLHSVWIKRWNNGDPRGAFSIFNLENKEFVGLVVAGGGGLAGESEIAYLLKTKYQGRGFGKEIVSAVVNNYIPWIKLHFENLDYSGKSLLNLTATSSPDNPASWKILDKLGFLAYSELHPVIDLNQIEGELQENEIFKKQPENQKFNILDKAGIVRTIEKRSRHGMLKWHFKLQVL